MKLFCILTDTGQYLVAYTSQLGIHNVMNVQYICFAHVLTSCFWVGAGLECGKFDCQSARW